MSSDVVTYRPGSGMSPRARRLDVAFWTMSALAWVVLGVSGQAWQFLVLAPLALLAPALRGCASRRIYRADANGIHARFVMNEPWERIESVKAPTQWDECTMVGMRETGEERRTGFPPSYAEQIAEIGGRSLS